MLFKDEKILKERAVGGFAFNGVKNVYQKTV
jgi:hypothetical protein